MEALQAAPRCAGYGGCSVFLHGQFALFTYLRPFLETVTHVDATALSILLLVIGVAGFIGTTMIGTFLKKGLYRTLAVIPVLMAVLAVALVSFGSSIEVTVTPLGFWGLVATAAPVDGGHGWHGHCRRMQRPAAG